MLRSPYSRTLSAYAMSDNDLAHGAIRLLACYAKPDTGIAYAVPEKGPSAPCHAPLRSGRPAHVTAATPNWYKPRPTTGHYKVALYYSASVRQYSMLGVVPPRSVPDTAEVST
eukprot:466798-Rhodomonas_salina.2